jgi:hypothetical protein
MSFQRTRWLIFACLVAFVFPEFVFAQAEPNLTKAEIKQFLLTAEILSGKHTSKGVTSPWRLILSDGKLTHDASFQSIDVRGSSAQMSDGAADSNPVDSYKFNVAAYVLAEMLGVEDILPVTVERRWQGKMGSLSWWLPAKMDAEEREKQKIEPPDPDYWWAQLYRIRVFNQLVFDSDFNRTNLLIGENWKLWRIDFSRAFRPFKEIQNAKQLDHCDRRLLEKLRKLDATELEQKTKLFLDKWERQGVIARRDMLVAHFEKLIAANGENNVLY